MQEVYITVPSGGAACPSGRVPKDRSGRPAGRKDHNSKESPDEKQNDQIYICNPFSGRPVPAAVSPVFQ